MRMLRVSRMLTLAACACSATAQPSGWPEKPLRVVVATAAGSGDDFVARLIAPKLSDLLRQQVLVDNRPGAAGLIGQTYVMKAAADGYTVLFAGGSMAGARYVNAQVGYDVQRDFTPVSLVVTTPFVLFVHPSVPARNLGEYSSLARAHPGRMTYAVSGSGQMPFWNALLFNFRAGIHATEVSYRSGSAAALSDVVAGRIDYIFTAAPVAIAHKTRLRALALTSAKRSPIFPEVPAIGEFLPGYDMPGWAGIAGPAGLRRDIVDALNKTIERVLATPEVHERMQLAGAEATSSSPEALARKYAEWIERFGDIARRAGIKPQ